jgi:hypothetical protein
MRGPSAFICRGAPPGWGTVGKRSVNITWPPPRPATSEVAAAHRDQRSLLAADAWPPSHQSMAWGFVSVARRKELLRRLGEEIGAGRHILPLVVNRRREVVSQSVEYRVGERAQRLGMTTAGRVHVRLGPRLQADLEGVVQLMAHPDTEHDDNDQATKIKVSAGNTMRVLR